ncbi:hypothetical protein ACFWOJ_02885 [Streptomyces sp. NPDC058439]|uniref:hypothetical protein n=1 Tax=Streptomyces sp. NPDC058439 TaxID=3346500 RepID=UPI003667B14F
MIAEYADALRAKTNRNGRPYAPRTIGAYKDAAIALHHWMTKETGACCAGTAPIWPLTAL